MGTGFGPDDYGVGPAWSAGHHSVTPIAYLEDHMNDGLESGKLILALRDCRFGWLDTRPSRSLLGILQISEYHTINGSNTL